MFKFSWNTFRFINTGLFYFGLALVLILFLSPPSTAPFAFLYNFMIAFPIIIVTGIVGTIDVYGLYRKKMMTQKFVLQYLQSAIFLFIMIIVVALVLAQ